MQRINAGQRVRLFFDDMFDARQELSFELERDSTLELVLLMRGVIPQRAISVHLIGENAQAHIKGLYILGSTQKVALETKQIHQAPYTTSSCTINGIVYDSGHAQYRGTIYVDKGADHTQARQVNKNILLSPLARATSVPCLEVLTKQVHCAHGSAVGTLDKDSMLYMQTRGLSAEYAQQLLLQGFAAQIMDGMPEDMVEQIKGLIR